MACVLRSRSTRKRSRPRLRSGSGGICGRLGCGATAAPARRRRPTLRADGSPALLGVELSSGGRRWQLRPADDRLVRALGEKLGLRDIVARIMAGRSIDLESAANFLE